MASSYQIALAAATHPSVKIQWADERPNILPVNDDQSPVLKTWLATLNCAVARNLSTWEAIKSNWISFLAATSRHPSSFLAPNRKRIQWGKGSESDARAQKRFREDQRERISVQGAIWRHFDSAEALVERWPRRARIMMNRVVVSDCQTPFASLMDDFGKQRRFNSIWSSLVCFLLYCFEEEGSLEAMGLKLSEELEDDLFDIQQALITEGYPKPGDAGEIGLIEQAIDAFLVRLLTDTSAAPETNPLLWWTIVLVRSSLETSPEDFISRGRFSLNILPMDLDIQQRLEGILHFAQVFLLSFAFTMWQPIPKTQLLEVQGDLNAVDNSWMGKYSSSRPTEGHDERTCDTPAWHSVLQHVEQTFTKFLGQSNETPMRQIVSLRNELMKLECT